MRRVLLPVLGTIILGLGTAPHAAEWAALVKVLEKSVVAIERNDAHEAYVLDMPRLTNF